MRKITRITTQIKNKNRYNIFLGEKEPGEYAFSVDEAVLIEFHLRKGLELDEELIHKIKQKDQLYKSYTQTIHFLSYRMRSKKEIINYLTEKEVPSDYIVEIVTRLENEKLINDREFAEMFVRSRMNMSTKGPRMIRNELIEKGIAEEHIVKALEQYTFATQYEKIVKIVQKKLQTSSRHPYRKRIEQLQMSLMQKGFSRDVIKEAVASVNHDRDDSEEWAILLKEGKKIVEKQVKKYEGYELEQKVKASLYQKGFESSEITRFIAQAFEK